MMRPLALLLFTLLIKTGAGQTFNGGGGSIPDNGNPINYTINVSGLPGPLDTIGFGLEQVCINIDHPYVSDLEVSLISPGGTTVTLTAGNGGSGDDYKVTCFRNSASTPITMGNPPFNGTFRPQEDMARINNQSSGNGPWRLHLYDTYAGADQGYLNNWSITFGSNPASPFLNFTSSNLPIIVLNTFNQPIPDDPKISCHMGIIYNGPGNRNYMTDPFNNYNGMAAIEIRGSSSQMFPKKSYGLETHTQTGLNNDTTILGFPAEHDWILSASYSDKTHLRNYLSYHLYRDFGQYAPRSVHCELVINGQYKGVYVFMEKIKRDPGRVDIASLHPWENSGDGLTGGYIVKIDKTTGSGGQGWNSPYPPAVNPNGQQIFFQYEYPSQDSLTPPQRNYIQQYVDSFETALAGPLFADTVLGYRKYAGVNTFIDYFILNEISRNVDGYRLSTYLYKDKYSKGGKLKIGPPWDYDIAWLNANYCSGSSSSGWAYQFGNVCSNDSWQIPFWWNRMMQDTNFTNALKCRWQQLRSTVLATPALHTLIDSLAGHLAEGMGRNFIAWPILGVYVWPNPTPHPTTYPGEINRLKSWITSRMNWITLNLPGTCNPLGVVDSGLESSLQVYPNPAQEELFIYSNAESIRSAEVFDIAGRLMIKGGSFTTEAELNLSALTPGIYMLHVNAGNRSGWVKIIKAPGSR